MIIVGDDSDETEGAVLEPDFVPNIKLSNVNIKLLQEHLESDSPNILDFLGRTSPSVSNIFSLQETAEPREPNIISLESAKLDSANEISSQLYQEPQVSNIVSIGNTFSIGSLDQLPLEQHQQTSQRAAPATVHGPSYASEQSVQVISGGSDGFDNLVSNILPGM